MSGLELAAGIIAVVQVTGQAAVLTAKIKRLWGEVRDAPEDIQDLLDEVELTSLLLQDIERQGQQTGRPAEAWSSRASEGILQHTQRAHQALQGAADLLDREIQRSQNRGRRIIASSKVLLKRPVLDGLRRRLEFSLKLLQLSTQMQTAAMVARATSVICERLPETSEPETICLTKHDDASDEKHSHDETEQNQIVRHSSAKRHHLARFDHRQTHEWTWTGRFSFNFSSGDGGWLSIQPPSWLARSTHVLMANRALGEVQLTLRRYETIENFGPKVYDLLSQDDWPGLELYFTRTGISPFATNRNGSSLVYLACVITSPKILKRLLELHSVIHELEDEDDIDFLRDWHNTAILPFPSNPDWHAKLEVMRMVLPFGLSPICNDFESLRNVMDRLPLEMLQPYMNVFMPATQTFSPLQKFQMACEVLLQDRYNDITVLLPELQALTSAVGEPSCIPGSDFLHRLMRVLSNPGWTVGDGHVTNILIWIGRCLEMDHEALHRVPSLETRFHWLDMAPQHVFPLSAFIVRMQRSWPFSDHRRGYDTINDTIALLGQLLSFLQDRAIDLKKIGRKERLQTRTPTFTMPGAGAAVYSWRFCTTIESRVDSRIRYIGISYGRRVDDWVLWYAWEYEHFAKEFWDMVENSSLELPGRWVEDMSEKEAEWDSLQEYLELNDDTSFVWSEVDDRLEG